MKKTKPVWASSAAPVVAPVVALVLALCGAAGPVAAIDYAALASPAVLSDRAQRAAIMAVAPAGRRLVAVGERGIVLLSDDDGATWRQASVPVEANLTAVQFVTPVTGWAVGHLGVVLRTDDGGQSWTKQLDGRDAARLRFDAASRRAAASNGEAARRQVAEAERFVQEGPDKPFFDLYFEDEMHGFIVGAFNLMFRTEDGGRSWIPWQDRIANDGGLHLYGIKGAAGALYLVGEQGLLLRSDDRGQSFVPLKSPYEGTFFGVAATRAGTVLAYGLRGNAFLSTDRGATWRVAQTGATATITASVELRDGGVALVDQAGGIAVSRDQGVRFERPAIPGGMALTGVAETASARLVLTGMQGVQTIAVPR